MTSIIGVKPDPGSTVGTRPVLGATITVDESDISIDFRIRVSTNPDPTVSPFWDISETRDYPFSGTIFTTTETFAAPANTYLTPGTWYIRVDAVYSGTASTISGSGTVGSFTASSVPGAIQTTPESGTRFSHSPATSYPLVVNWLYAQGSEDDFQTAYQVLVTKVSDGTTVVDTGKVSSSAQSATVNIPSANKEQELQWKVRVWNYLDSVSSYTGNRNFYVSTPPVVTITAPTQDQVLNAGNPSVTVTVGTSNGRTVSRITAELYQGTSRVWNKTITGTWANGTTGIIITDTNFYLQNNTSYKYRVWASDSAVLLSGVSSRDFSVVYTPPVAPGAVTISGSSYDADGYVSVTWPDTGRDVTNFFAWEVEREDSLLDPNTNAVLSVSDWQPVGAIYVPNAAGYTFRDFLAPSNHSVRYRVRQVVYLNNAETPGGYSTSGSTVISTTAYWLIAGVNGSSSTINTYKFFNVVADSYTDEVEQAEYNLIGRGRYVENGTELGVKGTLECQLRDTGGTTARQKKLALEEFKEEQTVATLRDPFGNSYYVSVGAISITRIPGTGKSEFTDISVPYSEVVSN